MTITGPVSALEPVDDVSCPLVVDSGAAVVVEDDVVDELLSSVPTGSVSDECNGARAAHAASTRSETSGAFERGFRVDIGARVAARARLAVCASAREVPHGS